MSSLTFAILIGTIALFVGMAAYDTWFWGNVTVPPSRERPKRWRRLLEWVCLGFQMASVAVFYYYSATRPDTIRPETGNIYRLRTVYVTLADYIRLYTLMGLALACVLVSGVHAKKGRAISS